MARIVKRVGKIVFALVLLLLMAGLWVIGPGNAGRMFFGIGTSYDTELPKLPALTEPAILIFSKTNGFRDDASIKAANAALEKLAKDKGWSSYTTESAAVFNVEQLSKFKAVVWNSVSGDVLTSEQRAAFKAWIEGGGGFVGLHGSGGDLSYDWDWYVNELIGAQFIGHTLSPQFQQGRLVIEDPNHPATRSLGKEWVRTEEWYSFDKSVRAKGYHVLVTLDEKSYSPREKIPFLVDMDLRMGADHPMVWTHCVGNGRALYSALGHQAESYAEAKHIALIAGAISWAAGLEGSTCEGGKDVAAVVGGQRTK
jgi:uncharacterized protein